MVTGPATVHIFTLLRTPKSHQRIDMMTLSRLHSIPTKPIDMVMIGGPANSQRIL